MCFVGSYECQGMLCDRIRCSWRHGRFDSCPCILLLRTYPYTWCIRFAYPSHETTVHVASFFRLVFLGVKTTTMGSTQDESSVLKKLDAAAAPLAKFDAFSKVPSAYKARSEGRGFVTLFLMFVVFMFMLNDVGEYIWGWPEFKFSVDKDNAPYMLINLDMVVNMPCRCECWSFCHPWIWQLM